MVEAVRNIDMSTNVTVNAIHILTTMSCTMRHHLVSSPRTRVSQFHTTHSATITRLGRLHSGITTRFNRGGTRLFSTRQLVLRSPSCTRYIRNLVTRSGIGTRFTIGDITRRFTTVFTTVSDSAVRTQTTSIGSISHHIVGILRNGHSDATRSNDMRNSTIRGNVIRGKATRGNRDRVVFTRSLTPDRATRLSHTGILNLIATGNSAGSRATVLTHAVNLPTVANVNSTFSPTSSNRITMVSNADNTMFISPSRTALARCQHEGTRTRSRLDLLQGLGNGPARAGSNRQIRLCTGVDHPSSTTTILTGSTRNVNLFHDRFLCLRHRS